MNSHTNIAFRCLFAPIAPPRFRVYAPAVGGVGGGRSAPISGKTASQEDTY